MKKFFLFTAIFIVSLAAFGQGAAEMINKANEAMKNKQYAQAFELYDKALSNLGDVQVDASINYNAAIAALQSDNNEAALKYFDKAIEANVNVSKCHENKASLYNKLKDYKNALLSYEKSIETSTEDTGQLTYNAAVSAVRAEDYTKAIVYFDKSIAANVKAEDAILNKAGILKKTADNNGYKSTLLGGVEKFPANKKMASALANVYVSEGNALYVAGVEIMNAANKKVNDGDFTVEDAAYIAEIGKAKAEFAKAIVILENAKKLDAENANAQKLLDACSQVK